MTSFLDPIAIIAILIALSIHEWAHAFAANRLGDPTAKMEGRLTVNPIAHLDPIGTILFLIVGFGWGKPVPVDPGYFKKPKRDGAIVAAAGPISNFVLAGICFVLLALFVPGDGMAAEDLLLLSDGGSLLHTFLFKLLGYSIFINLSLMAFNLLPIAPLDGSKVLHLFIPLRHEDTYMRFMQQGPMLLLFIIIGERLLNFSILSPWVTTIVTGALTIFSALFGTVL